LSNDGTKTIYLGIEANGRIFEYRIQDWVNDKWLYVLKDEALIKLLLDAKRKKSHVADCLADPEVSKIIAISESPKKGVGEGTVVETLCKNCSRPGLGAGTAQEKTPPK